MPLQFKERQGEAGATGTWREAGTTFSLGAALETGLPHLDSTLPASRTESVSVVLSRPVCFVTTAPGN